MLSELSTSYKEKTQLYCARALCNLACHHGSEKSLVDGGGVSALMMIALVRKMMMKVAHAPAETHEKKIGIRCGIDKSCFSFGGWGEVARAYGVPRT